MGEKVLTVCTVMMANLLVCEAAEHPEQGTVSHPVPLVHRLIPLFQRVVTIEYLMSACLTLEHTRVVFLAPFICFLNSVWKTSGFYHLY